MSDESSDNDDEIYDDDNDASANNGNTIAEDDIAEIANDDDGTGGVQIYVHYWWVVEVGAPNGSIPEQTDQEGKKGNKPESIPKALW